jgi:hypothetical protein
MNRIAVFATVLCVTISVHAATVTFDFDTGVPPLAPGLNTPLEQTSDGVTGTFRSPGEPGSLWSIQDASSTNFVTSLLSANYIYPNSGLRETLEIRFDQLLTHIVLNFALIEFHDPGATPLQLTAYRASNLSQPVGSAQVNANAPGSGGVPETDQFAQGVLSFDSAGVPFDLVRIVTVSSGPEGGTGFLADDITVTTAEQQVIPDPTTVTLFAFGAAFLIGVRHRFGRRRTGRVS